MTHESETIIGRITRNGTWDRRYSTQRCTVCGSPRHPRAHNVVPKKPNQDSASLKEFFIALLVITVWVAAIYLWAPILSVMQ